MRRWLWLPISGVLLGFVVWRTRPWEAGDLLGRLDPLALCLALVLNGAIILFWALRSRTLMAGVGHPLALRELVPVVSFANTINNLTPASSGEVLRAWILRDRFEVPYARSAAVILVERFWALGIMVLTAAAAATGPILRLPAAAQGLAWLAAIIGSFLPAALYRVGSRPGRLIGPLARRDTRLGRVSRQLVDLDETMARLVAEPRRALVFVATTGLAFSCYALQLAAVLAAFGAPIPIDAAWAALGLAMIAGALSALPFGLGAADVVLVALLTAIGVPVAVAGATTLLLRAVTTLPLGIAGAISWAYLTGPDRRRPRGAEPSSVGADGLTDPPPTGSGRTEAGSGRA